MKKFFEDLEQVERELKTVDHMIYVTFPLVRDKNILIKNLLKIRNIVATCINLILQYEYVHKKIELSTDPNSNFALFKDNCSRKYLITREEVKEIERLFDLAKSHRQSPMEFIKDGRVIILSDKMLRKTFQLEDVKKFIELSKNLIVKTKAGFSQQMHS